MDPGVWRDWVESVEIRQFVQFGLVGAGGAVINLSLLYGLTTGGAHYLVSGAVAIEAALLFNFFANMAWTFSDRDVEGTGGVLRALGRDHGVRLVGMGLNLFFLWFFTDVVGIFYVVSQVLGASVAALWNYAGNVFWTWKI